jgi:phage shock protein A
MSIFDRIRRITAANVGAVLDRAENPEKLLKQRIRELEGIVGDAKKSLSEFAVSLKKSEREQEQLKRLREEWASKAANSLQAEDEAMARQALGEKLKAEARLSEMEPSVSNSQATYASLKENLTSLQTQLRDSKLKIAELTTRKSAANAQRDFGTTFDKASGHLTDGDGDMAKMVEDVLRAESEAEIESEIRGDMTSFAKTEKASAEMLLDAELATLKKQLAK